MGAKEEAACDLTQGRLTAEDAAHWAAPGVAPRCPGLSGRSPHPALPPARAPLRHPDHCVDQPGAHHGPGGAPASAYLQKEVGGPGSQPPPAPLLQHHCVSSLSQAPPRHLGLGSLPGIPVLSSLAEHFCLAPVPRTPPTPFSVHRLPCPSPSLPAPLLETTSGGCGAPHLSRNLLSSCPPGAANAEGPYQGPRLGAPLSC